MSETTSPTLDAVPSLDSVEASVNYARDFVVDAATAKPKAYTYARPNATRPPLPSRHQLPIFDARPQLGSLSLDEDGFTLVPLESATRDFYDTDLVRQVYYPEVEQLVLAATGARRVHVFDHNVRNRPMAKRRENNAQAPVKLAHNDYTLKSGPQRVRDLLPDEADALLARRFAVINVWKPIRVPAQDFPLAVCHAKTIEHAHWIPMDLKYQDRTGEVYSLAFHPDQRWFYFRDMQPNEALLLKCYDSEDDGRARFTAHTAFRDRTAAEDAPARESVEVRTIAFF